MPGNGPLFLARAVYRRRRLRDAARLLPLVGLVLILLPALGRARAGSAGDAVYLFIIWAVMIAVAALLAPGLSKTETGEDPPDAAEDAADDPAPQDPR